MRPVPEILFKFHMEQAEVCWLHHQPLIGDVERTGLSMIVPPGKWIKSAGKIPNFMKFGIRDLDFHQKPSIVE